MALPMIHLLAASIWSQDKNELIACPEYYLGTLSPDAIHIRDGDDKSHKDEIHLGNWRRPNPQNVINYWREHNTPFDIGYGIHVLLDGQWATGFRADFPKMLLPGGKPVPRLYYNDTCQIDFALYADCGGATEYMKLLPAAKVPTDHPLLTAYEISAWRDEMIAFYQRPCPMSDPIRFITRDYVETFLHTCQQLMTDTYNSAFTR